MYMYIGRTHERSDEPLVASQRHQTLHIAQTKDCT